MKIRTIGVFVAILLIAFGTFAKSPTEFYTLTLAGAKEPTVVVTDKSSHVSFHITVNKYCIDIDLKNNTKNILSIIWESSSYTDFDGKSYGLYLSEKTIQDITEKFNEKELTIMIPSGWSRFQSIIPKNHYIDGVFPKLVPLLPKDAKPFVGKTAKLKLCCEVNKRKKYFVFNFVVNKVVS
jgi:hypothetical protein